MSDIYATDSNNIKKIDQEEWGVNDSGSILGRGRKLLSSPPRPDRLWSHAAFLSSAYRRHFPQRWSGRGANL